MKGPKGAVVIGDIVVGHKVSKSLLSVSLKFFLFERPVSHMFHSRVWYLAVNLCWNSFGLRSFSNPSLLVQLCSPLRTAEYNFESCDMIIAVLTTTTSIV